MWDAISFRIFVIGLFFETILCTMQGYIFVYQNYYNVIVNKNGIHLTVAYIYY